MTAGDRSGPGTRAEKYDGGGQAMLASPDALALTLPTFGPGLEQAASDDAGERCQEQARQVINSREGKLPCVRGG